MLGRWRTAIEELLQGRQYFSPRIPKRSDHGGVADSMGFGQLTAHQQKIVRMMAKGMTPFSSEWLRRHRLAANGHDGHGPAALN